MSRNFHADVQNLNVGKIQKKKTFILNSTKIS